MILLLYGMTLYFIRQAGRKKSKNQDRELQIPVPWLPNRDLT